MEKKYFDSKQYYPTPKPLLDKMLAGIKWQFVHTILEPSAGTGNIVDYIRNDTTYADYFQNKMDIDCIELCKEFRSILKGKKYRVVHDDFMTFKTFKKYDLIVMNPPFNEGAAHLSKAIELQKNGGSIICVLNAETLKNPFSNERKVLVDKLQELDADVAYYQEAFTNAERSAEVEVAVVKVLIPEAKRDSRIMERLKKAHSAAERVQESASLVVDDVVEATVAQYNLEAESGVELIHEYQALIPFMMTGDDRYAKPILELKIDSSNYGEATVNDYLKKIRSKYWEKLFSNDKFIAGMPMEMLESYRKRVSELADYDFSTYNIRVLQIEMMKGLVSQIEDGILKLFDELSFQYSYSDELGKNIHYYNGWCTNKAWYINKKVILPNVNAYHWLDNRYNPTSYDVIKKLENIECVLNYLDGGRIVLDGKSRTGLHDVLLAAEKEEKTRNIETKYLRLTFYKKGTCHIEFLNEDLLKKLNIYGSQKKGWLPQGYGKRRYAEMSREEQKVVDSFEGIESYNKTLEKADYFLGTISMPTVSLLGEKTA